MYERVSLRKCGVEASDTDVVLRTQEAISALGDYGRGLRNARKIAVKINAGIDRIRLTDGKQTELTEPAVVEGVIRAIRDMTDAEIVIGDAPTHGDGSTLYAALGYPERLKQYANVRLLDFGEGELVDVSMPESAGLFTKYRLHKELSEADAFVSVAKMKAHTSMGCTLCIKNLFGWTPPSIYGVPRHYFHDRLIRLPRVLADLAFLFKPCLNVVDGIVAANLSEWHGEPMKPGVIIAGTNVVATDHIGARVMGFNPQDDYPSHPFLYRRNAIKLAAEMGLGQNSPEQIEVVGESPEDVALPFRVEPYGEGDRNAELRRGADCVARYRENQGKLAAQYQGRYLALSDGQIVWNENDIHSIMRLESESGLDWRTLPQFIVRCVRPDDEIERFQFYEQDAGFQRVAANG